MKRLTISAASDAAGPHRSEGDSVLPVYLAPVAGDALAVEGWRVPGLLPSGMRRHEVVPTGPGCEVAPGCRNPIKYECPIIGSVAAFAHICHRPLCTHDRRNSFGRRHRGVRTVHVSGSWPLSWSTTTICNPNQSAFSIINVVDNQHFGACAVVQRSTVCLQKKWPLPNARPMQSIWQASTHMAENDTREGDYPADQEYTDSQ